MHSLKRVYAFYSKKNENFSKKHLQEIYFLRKWVRRTCFYRRICCDLGKEKFRLLTSLNGLYTFCGYIILGVLIFSVYHFFAIKSFCNPIANVFVTLQYGENSTQNLTHCIKNSFQWTTQLLLPTQWSKKALSRFFHLGLNGIRAPGARQVRISKSSSILQRSQTRITILESERTPTSRCISRSNWHHSKYRKKQYINQNIKREITQKQFGKIVFKSNEKFLLSPLARELDWKAHKHRN